MSHRLRRSSAAPAAAPAAGVARVAGRVPARAGFSLLELLLVMVVLGLVLGAGLGAFATLDLTEDRSAERVRAALSSASSAAVQSGLPASVVVELGLDRGEGPSEGLGDEPPAAAIEDRAEAYGGQLRVRSAQPVGTWQFERGETGPRGLRAELRGAEGIDVGYLGAAVDLGRGGQEASVAIALQGDSRYDPREGFHVSLFAIVQSDAASGRLLDLGGSAMMQLHAGGAVSASVTPMVRGENGLERPGGRVLLRSAEASLPVRRWVELELIYDRERLTLRIDGLPVAAVELDHPVAPLEGALVLGGAPNPAPAAVDALNYAVYGQSPPIELPQTFLWPVEAPTRIRFGPDGALDPRAHPEPLRLELPVGAARLEIVTVGRLGGLSTEVLEFDPGAP